MDMTGKVISTNLSKKGGIPKFPKEFINIYEYGVEGDFHSGKINYHANKNNINRQISIVSNEIINNINNVIGKKLYPGSLGENILIEGLGYLENFKKGMQLKIGKSVILEITGQNQPCATLNKIDEKILKLIVGKRGLLARVIKIGLIKKGDEVQIIN
tara:strand:+ start:563 stop:1036 length:474 start_codon:yes stop_codon:yes gene_type:complete